MTIVPAVARLLPYDNPRSSNALKVRILPAEPGLPYERRTIALSLSPHPNLLALREHLIARPAFAAADPVG